MADKPSGHQYRVRRAAAEAQAEAEAIERKKLDAADRFADLEAPPTDVIGGIEWAHRATTRLLHQVLIDPAIDEDKRRKQGAELTRALGMISVKALYETRLLKLEGKVYGRRGKESDGQAPGEDHEPT
jgi:hypothetical protein